MDDSKNGISKFINRNPNTNFVCRINDKVAVNALADEGIKKAALVVFVDNKKGNAFWESIGFFKRDDLNYRNIVIDEMKV